MQLVILVHFYSTAGADYVMVNTTLTFSPGNLTQCVDISIIIDTIVEPDQIFSVTLSDLEGPDSITLGSTISATVTITDNGKYIL